MITKYSRVALPAGDDAERVFLRDLPTNFTTFQFLVSDYLDQYIVPRTHITQYAIIWAFVITVLNSSFLWSDASVLIGQVESLWLFQVRHLLAKEPTVLDLSNAALFLGFRCASCGAHGSLPGACVRLCAASISDRFFSSPSLGVGG